MMHLLSASIELTKARWERLEEIRMADEGEAGDVGFLSPQNQLLTQSLNRLTDTF